MIESKHPSTMRIQAGLKEFFLRPANADMIDGYMDGFKDDRAAYPESLSNRSRSYKHGWLNGLEDRTGKLRGLSIAEKCRVADEAMELDDAERVR